MYTVPISEREDYTMPKVKHQTIKKTYVVTDATAERLAALTELLEMSETKVVEHLVKDAAVQAGIEKSPAKRLQAILKS